jgi:hypothetical protein
MRMITERLRKIEGRGARFVRHSRPAKAERDLMARAMLHRSGARETALAAATAEPNVMIRERSRAVVEAFWRADT